MDYRRFGNTIAARIDKGEEILEQVKAIALKEEIKLARPFQVLCKFKKLI